jgi:hypothetical protein
MSLTSSLINGYGIYDQAERLGQAGDQFISGANQLAQQAQTGSEFKPFTVTGPSGGSASATANGGVDYSLDPMGNQISNTANFGALSMFQQAQMPNQEREQDVYDRIRATQMPEEYRQQSLMEGRLNAQGRSGIRSEQYGGTPEQLAYHKAVQEAQNGASLAAIQQGQAEQMQQGKLGGMLQNAAYMPQAQLSNLYNQGLQTSQLQQSGQLGGQSLASQLGMSGLGMGLETELARAQLIGNGFSTLGNSVGNSTFDPLGDVASSGWDWLKQQFQPSNPSGGSDPSLQWT